MDFLKTPIIGKVKKKDPLKGIMFYYYTSLTEKYVLRFLSKECFADHVGQQEHFPSLPGHC